MSLFFKRIFFLIMFLKSINPYLIRPNNIYEHIIKEVCNYYYCNSIILFYSNPDQINSQGIEESTRLRNLLIFLNKQSIRTAITSVNRFTQDIIKNSNKLNNMLLVFLDGSPDLKNQLIEQLEPAIDMSDPIWLIFLQPETEIDHYFDGLDIPFNCRFMVSQQNTSDSNNREIITELYRVWKDKELRYDIFGSWSPIAGMKLPTKTLYKRRNSLHGHTLRASVLHWPPLTLLTVDEDNKTELIGSTGGVINALQQNMNFTSKLLITKTFGTRLKNGTWTGAIGNIVSDYSDMCFLFFQMSTARMEVIKYTTPFYRTRYYFYSRKPDVVISWKAFLMPFHCNIWTMVICTILASSTLIKLTFNFYQRKFPQTTIHEKDLKRSSMLLSIFGSFCNQATPRSSIDSIAIIQYTINLTAVIIYTAYSGILISSLMIDTTLTHRKSLEDILNDNDHRIGVLKNSGLHQTLKITSNVLLREIYEKKVLPDELLPNTHQEGIDRVCEENFMYLGTNLYVLNLKKADCIVRTSEVVFDFSNSLALQKSSPFREFFNYQINLLRENGAIDKFLSTWVKTKQPEEIETYEAVDIFEVLALFVFLGGNFLLSFLFLSWEIFHLKKWNLRRMLQSNKEKFLMQFVLKNRK